MRRSADSLADTGRLLGEGACDFIEKPFADDTILSAIAAALVDLDPLNAGLRVAAQVTTGELAGLLAEAGYPVGPMAIQPQPSVCCGGCGG